MPVIESKEASNRPLCDGSIRRRLYLRNHTNPILIVVTEKPLTGIRCEPLNNPMAYNIGLRLI
jgi:hypothetical protein